MTCTDDDDSEIVIDIDLSTVGHCTFLSVDQVKEQLEWYIYLNRAPSMNEKSTRISVPAPGDANSRLHDSTEVADLEAIANTPCLCIVFPLDHWENVTEMVSQSGVLGVPSLLTHISPPLDFIRRFGSNALDGFVTSDNIEFLKKHLEADDLLWAVH